MSQGNIQGIIIIAASCRILKFIVSQSNQLYASLHVKINWNYINGYRE